MHIEDEMEWKKKHLKNYYIYKNKNDYFDNTKAKYIKTQKKFDSLLSSTFFIHFTMHLFLYTYFIIFLIAYNMQ